MKTDSINRPQHYCNHASGHEAITLCEQMPFVLGNAFKYLYRCGLKGSALEDLKKAEWYLKREFDKRFKRLFTWDAPEDYAPEGKIADVLAYESRYGGHMKAALKHTWATHRYPYSCATLLPALDSVREMIRIELRKEAHNATR